MCGIAGVVGDGRPSEALLGAMSDELRHRGPDSAGAWSDERAHLLFRRLSIIDLNERSNQPLHLGPLHLVFNGEIYNYRELREKLTRLDHTFTTEGDGEVLLHAVRQWGEHVFDHLNGMFAFAVWDDERRTLMLATDPFGEKPLLYCDNAASGWDSIAFASDARALGLLDPRLLEPDRLAVEEFVALDKLPSAPATMFARIKRLPPAHFAIWEGGRMSVSRYWTPARVEVPIRYEDAVEALRALLRDSVSLRLRSDVPVGTSLSGGVDSSTVACLMGELTGDHRRHAFTATFPGFARDEWAYASTAAKAADIAFHHPVEPTEEGLLNDLEELISFQEEPFSTTSIYAQWCVMREAHRADVTVLLDGQGADELFGGYAGLEGIIVRARGGWPALLGAARDPSMRGSALRALAAGRAPRSLARIARRRAASPYVSGQTAERASRRTPPQPFSSEPNALRRELLTQSMSSSLPHLLRYADRNSMAHSREVRLPFLDRRIAEYALSLPPQFLYDEGQSKRILRDAARPAVPALVLDRPDKVGFEAPHSRWLAAPAVKRRLAEVVLDRGAAFSMLVQRSEIERDLRAGHWRDANAAWRLWNAELWHRAVVSSSSLTSTRVL